MVRRRVRRRRGRAVVRLLDSNAFVWAVAAPQQLSARAREAVTEDGATLWVSPLLHYELSQKAARGKLQLAMAPIDFVERGIEQLGAIELPLRLSHTRLSDALQWHHRDPFDRLLALQALAEGMSIVSSDSVFDRYGVERIW